MRLLLIAAVSLFVTPAVAGDYDWTGFYAGILAGGSITTSHAEMNSSFAAPSYNPLYFGASIGVEAGANIQVENVVLGVAVDASMPIARTPNDPCLTNPYFSDPDRPPFCEPVVGSEFTMRATLGMPIGGALVYATGGIAIGRITTAIYPAIEREFHGASVATDTLATGWVAGAGATMPVTSNIRIKAEYLYSAFGQMLLKPDTGPSWTVSVATQQIRAGVEVGF